MQKNTKFGKLNEAKTAVGEYAPSVLIVDGTAIFTPTADDYHAAGWKTLNNMSYPTEPAPTGYHYEEDGFDETDTDITKKWKTVADPTVYRKFSKLKIYGAIVSLPDVNGVTAWNTIKTWLEGKDVNGVNGWMAFQLAQEISEGHELFAAWSEEARVLLGLTTEQFEALLNQCILDGGVV